MSTSLANIEETPSWDNIHCALRLLFSRFEQLDLTSIGTTQRLQYEDFEMVFYHLFLIMDQTDTKRKFRDIFPARNQEERTKFIQLSVRCINDKQLSSQRVAASQLRMCGGEPFRRLMANLIKAATEKEIHSIRRIAPDCMGLHSSQDIQTKGENLDFYIDKICQKQQKVKELSNNLKETIDRLKQLKENVNEAKRLHQEKWNFLSTKLDGVSYSYNHRHMQAICRSLFSRLEQANAKSKAATEKIKKIQLPTEGTDDIVSSGKKRLSQFIREVRDQFDSSRIVDKIGQQLVEYDNGVDKIIETWQEEQERADENLLKNPEIFEKFRFFENIVPKIDLKPIGHVDNTKEKPLLSSIEQILNQFSDPKYDDREIVEASRAYFNENTFS